MYRILPRIITFRSIITVNLISRIMSSNFKAIGSDFAVDGFLGNEEELNKIKENYNGVLYLNPDTNGDLGIYDGFSTLQNAFQDNAIKAEFNIDDLTKNMEGSLANVYGIAKYREYEAAIDKLPRPTLIMCKSNRRAGTVLAAYLSVKFDIPADFKMEQFQAEGHTFPSHPVLSNWVRNSYNIMSKKQKNLFFRQFFDSETSTYTYLLADLVSKEAIIIDPVLEKVQRDADTIRQLGLNLKYILNTHVHADHITGSGLLKREFPEALSAIAEIAGAQADIQLTENEKLHFGDRFVFGLSTPGHTAGCFSFVLDNLSAVFTGDALLIRGCGRTDFQVMSVTENYHEGGSAEQLYESVTAKLFALSDDTIVYPAHDYLGRTASTIREEKTYNPRLTKSKEEFVRIMANLNLPLPNKIDVAVPANLRCGL